MKWTLACGWLLGGALVGALAERESVGAVDLLARYPTGLVAGDATPERARVWEFGGGDVYAVSGFDVSVGAELRVQIGSSDVGIGHCDDGAVWAVVLPREGGTLRRGDQPEERIRHLWLRFHPGEIGRLFPPAQVTGAGDSALAARVRRVAAAKLGSSWHAGPRVMIPEPKDLTVDADTESGARRFFSVDREAGTARYVPAFENRPVRPAPLIQPEWAASCFDQLWEAFDQKYALFTLRPEVDWARAREMFRPRALAARSTDEFGEICAEMLRPLRDLHVWLKVAGVPVPVFNRPRAANANARAYRVLIGELNRAGRRVAWARTPEGIGFLLIEQWDDGEIPAQVDRALEALRETRALVIDVRLNGGGSEPLAQQVAGRFVPAEAVYAFSQYRSGPAHKDLTKKFPRLIVPRGPWRYDRPVVLLIGEKCMSSNESFIAMMSRAPQVTTMGSRTCGSSGNPMMLDLPLEMNVSVPKWIDYRPDGMPLDEAGLQPDVEFSGSAEAFSGERDELLKAALARLHAVPAPVSALPEVPVKLEAKGAAESPLAREERPTAESIAGRPRVVAVWPENGSEVPAETELRIQFDQRMDPDCARVVFAEGGLIASEFPEYDAERREFRIRVRLTAGMKQRVVLNEPRFRGTPSSPREGFQSVAHVPAAQWQWEFRTQGGDGTVQPQLLSPSPPADLQERVTAARSDARLQDVVARIRQRRREITSIVEVVQVMDLAPRRGCYGELTTTAALFKWQGNQYWVDASGPMLTCADFRIGSDGERCWFYAECTGSKTFVVAPSSDIQQQNISVSDALDASGRTVAETIERSRVIYAGMREHGGRKCHLLEAWTVRASGSLTNADVKHWSIDAETFLPVEIAEHGAGYTSRRRYREQRFNETLAASEFAPPEVGIAPGVVDPLDERYTVRFLNVMDGGAGRMSVRWGKRGPKAQSSGGLN